MYPSNTCWLHVDESNMYTPISDYSMLKKCLTLTMKDNVELYFNNLKKAVLEMKADAMAICLDINIPKKQMPNVLDQFAGCAIRMQSDTRDWTRYVLNDYSLVIECNLRSNEAIDMWVEIKGYAIELCKQCSTLKYNE